MISPEKMHFVAIEVLKVQHIIAKAAKLILVQEDDEGNSRDEWIPLSAMAMNDAEEIYRGEKDITIRIHKWYADKTKLQGIL